MWLEESLCNRDFALFNWKSVGLFVLYIQEATVLLSSHWPSVAWLVNKSSRHWASANDKYLPYTDLIMLGVSWSFINLSSLYLILICPTFLREPHILRVMGKAFKLYIIVQWAVWAIINYKIASINYESKQTNTRETNHCICWRESKRWSEPSDWRTKYKSILTYQRIDSELDDL